METPPQASEKDDFFTWCGKCAGESPQVPVESFQHALQALLPVTIFIPSCAHLSVQAGVFSG